MNVLVIVALFVAAAHALPADPKIVGGVNATPHQAPYIVSVQVFREERGFYRHTCGGSIISAEWILTAGHCITEHEPLQAPLRIVAGEHNFAVESGQEQIRLTPTVVIHEDYAGGVAPFDIALLGVESPLQLITGVVQTIRLPQPNSIPSGNVRLFGWGSISTTNEAVIPDILQTVVKDVLSLDMCREVLLNKYPGGTPLHSTNVCTGPLDSIITACSGDSGGPIVQAGAGGVLEVVGVASWISAFPCGAINAVTVYVRSSAFNDWITNTTGPLP
jgi:secreted trypsin-like serine protease